MLTIETIKMHDMKWFPLLLYFFLLYLFSMKKYCYSSDLKNYSRIPHRISYLNRQVFSGFQIFICQKFLHFMLFFMRFFRIESLVPFVVIINFSYAALFCECVVVSVCIHFARQINQTMYIGLFYSSLENGNEILYNVVWRIVINW